MKNIKTISVVAVLVIALVLGIIKMRSGTDDELVDITPKTDDGSIMDDGNVAGDDSTVTNEPKNVVVHVCGSVSDPGVYTLPEGSRIYEAVSAAGGFSNEAATAYLNLAGVLNDGMKIYVPTEEEVQSSSGMLFDMQDPSLSESAGGTDTLGRSLEDTGSGGKVNLNTATKEELMTLKGVGASRAESIIAYREANGAFHTIEEIMNVDGIKEGMFGKIRDDISV